MGEFAVGDVVRLSLSYRRFLCRLGYTHGWMHNRLKLHGKDTATVKRVAEGYVYVSWISDDVFDMYHPHQLKKV